MSIQGKWNSRMGPLQGTAQDEAGTSGYSSRKGRRQKLRKIKLPAPTWGGFSTGKGSLPASSVFMIRCC